MDFPIRQHIEAMLNIQQHRGPDASGIWLSPDDHLGLCHNRLAIIDLTEAANQPMYSLDKRYVIVFNGEIYNYLELRKQLEAVGSNFFSHSDTEVILEAWRYWGENMLQRLRGMFAFAIYDQHDRVLFCARDKVGKKPFVYSQTETAFVFASEIPAVRQVAGVDINHDHDAIAAMLLHNLRHIPDPHTAYCGIKRLRAGHAMIVRNGQIERIWRYWTPEPSSGETTLNRLRELLEESVALRMRADVPVGALLSGGVDSSSIVAMMQQRASAPVSTYALGFDSTDEDIQRARLMAQKLGTIHKEFYFDPEEQWDVFRKLLSIHGEPIMLLPLVHAHILFRAIQNDGIKVALVGNGADEIFYGYTGHTRTLKVSRYLDRLGRLRYLFSPFKSTRMGWLAAKPGVRKAAWYRGLARKEWVHYLSEDALTMYTNKAAEELAYWGELCPSKRFIDESNFTGLMVENTHSVTTASDLPAMAASVESRAPFLDQAIVSFALATPVEKKIPDVNNPNWLKAILRESVRDLVPDTLLNAPKRGFGMGIQESTLLDGGWKKIANEIFHEPDEMNGFFSRERIQVLWKRFQTDRRCASNLMKVLAIQTWLKDAGR
jgi:asparagine synthase (glutamine-hydrolysing)